MCNPTLRLTDLKPLATSYRSALASGFADRDVRYALVDAAVSANLGRLAPQLRSPRMRAAPWSAPAARIDRPCAWGPLVRPSDPESGKISEVAAGSERQPAAEPALQIDREA